ncbi:MAG: cell division protein FtsI/penicillin-binding protein 2 [Actinomycetia bacterium]|nr:cell division protein FtsI/penicillin-binding protein 2 [Actinomycetes bacterium]
MNGSIRRVGIVVMLLLIGLVAQLSYLQIFHAQALNDNPRNTRRLEARFAKPRGEILSADGKVLARSVPTTDLYKYQRQYPAGPLFAQIVGYHSLFRNTGVEAQYDTDLTGDSSSFDLANAKGLFTGKQVTGNVVLTLRSDLQFAAMSLLGDQKGSIIVMDTKTGGILAMYSNPSFDPGPMASHDQHVVETTLKALDATHTDVPASYAGLYPPGSTFKVVTAGVALDTGLATPTTPSYPILQRLTLPQTSATLANFGPPSNPERCGGTLAQSFTVSCNTTFGQVGLNLGESFVPGMDKFGIGSTPPLDLRNPGAVASQGPSAGSFAQNKPQFALAGIGQGPVAVSPLQMALVAATVADNGVVPTPHVVDQIQDTDGGVVRRVNPGAWRTAIKPETAAELNTMMVSVVQSGTGTSARIPGVTVAGKTGTAQQNCAPGVTPCSPHAWFIGFAPAEAPRYAVAVIVERGGSIGSEATGGHLAAPLAQKMLVEALKH